MKSFFRTSACLILSIILWQCDEARQSSDLPEGSEAEEIPAAMEISYETKIVEMQSNPCGGGTPCASVYLSAPVLKDTAQPARRQIQQQIMQEMTRAFMEEEEFSDLNEVANGFVEAYRITQEQNEGYEKSWSLTRSAEVYANTDALFGVRFSNSVDMGGETPITTVDSLNFDPATGKMLNRD